jgi:hypothetical protein
MARRRETETQERRIKIFWSAKLTNLEEEINAWLATEQPDHIYQVLQTETKNNLTITILYLPREMPDPALESKEQS